MKQPKTVKSLEMTYDRVKRNYCIKAVYSDCSISYYEHGSQNYVKIQLKFEQEVVDSMNRLTSFYKKENI
jgi:hypothetical protein